MFILLFDQYHNHFWWFCYRFILIISLILLGHWVFNLCINIWLTILLLCYVPFAYLIFGYFCFNSINISSWRFITSGILIFIYYTLWYLSMFGYFSSNNCFLVCIDLLGFGDFLVLFYIFFHLFQVWYEFISLKISNFSDYFHILFY